MNESTLKVTTWQLILVPAVISLAVTLIRLIGELNRWSALLFNREAGGPGAIIGIVWLVPIFAVYFAVRLDKAGEAPESRPRAIGHAAAALGLFALLLTLAMLFSSTIVQVVLINVAAIVSALIAYRGWPRLGWIQFAYGLAARIPVAIVMLVAMSADWGTHYELGPPGFPTMSLFPKWVLIGLIPQLVFWVSFTMIVGALFGSLALLFRRTGQ